MQTPKCSNCGKTATTWYECLKCHGGMCNACYGKAGNKCPACGHAGKKTLKK
jgi:hypothetical protein